MMNIAVVIYVQKLRYVISTIENFSSKNIERLYNATTLAIEIKAEKIFLSFF